MTFASTVRTLSAAARARGLTVPGFRSPPRSPGVERTLQRLEDGSVLIAVVVRNRPFQAVVADMIEGVVVVNELDEREATRIRTQLWEDVLAEQSAAAWPGAA